MTNLEKSIKYAKKALDEIESEHEKCYLENAIEFLESCIPLDDSDFEILNTLNK